MTLSAAKANAAPLEVAGIGVRFGGTFALSDVSFRVERGERVGLIGPNGAGKTTLLGVVSGFVRPTSGRVFRHGQDATALAAEVRARAGIGRTFQQSSRFGALTAAESVAIAILAHRTDRPFLRSVVGRGGSHLKGALANARVLLAELGVDAFGDVPAGDLPLGIARLVDVARAISGGPDLLLLDEPSSGLDTHERDHLSAFVRRHAAESGSAVVLVEHDVEFVQSLCERIVVLDFGRKIADGPTTTVLADPAVRAAYLGQDRAPAEVSEGPVRVAEQRQTTGQRTVTPPDAALELRGVSAGYGRSPAITGVTLAMPRGTVTAVLGPNGSGKTTLARVVTGNLKPWSGHVILDGRDVTGSPPARLARQGVFHVPDERAIYPSLTVRENLRMALRHAVAKREVNGEIERVMELLPVLGSRRVTLAGSLSGGEQQMLAIARALVVPPAILVVDELSHGLSPIAVGHMFDILARLKGEVTMLVIEQFTEHALQLADTVVALRRGVVIHDGPADAVTDEDLVSWYALNIESVPVEPSGSGPAPVASTEPKSSASSPK